MSLLCILARLYAAWRVLVGRDVLLQVTAERIRIPVDGRAEFLGVAAPEERR